jgi:hypothetical protein
MVFMVNIIKQEVVIEESLKKKLELICEFSNTTLKIINGSIRKIDRTNLIYVEPHRIIINNKIIIKSKNRLWDENEKLKEENEDLKRLNYQYENQYKSLKEKTDYLIYHLNKVLKKLPEFIQNIVERLFNYSGLDLKYFKQQYDPEVIRKREKSFKGFNLFNKKEIEKATKHLNNEMDESAEEFYKTKKDDGLKR